MGVVRRWRRSQISPLYINRSWAPRLMPDAGPIRRGCRRPPPTKSWFILGTFYIIPVAARESILERRGRSRGGYSMIILNKWFYLTVPLALMVLSLNSWLLSSSWMPCTERALRLRPLRERNTTIINAIISACSKLHKLHPRYNSSAGSCMSRVQFPTTANANQPWVAEFRPPAQFRASKAISLLLHECIHSSLFQCTVR
jgi:hypothetical protein